MLIAAAILKWPSLAIIIIPGLLNLDFERNSMTCPQRSSWDIRPGHRCNSHFAYKPPEALPPTPGALWWPAQCPSSEWPPRSQALDGLQHRVSHLMPMVYMYIQTYPHFNRNRLICTYLHCLPNDLTASPFFDVRSWRHIRHRPIANHPCQASWPYIVSWDEYWEQLITHNFTSYAIGWCYSPRIGD